ncbi:release factor glutamine methyltransferase [Quadrisphaera granulorum]|uniref:Release factor glutamine methyltransferase n=1 Tax=Quadrisphaera granulorum TaxID=317664 RepID=A0A316A576_9ACTN|nr:putative protein N(5)-glutamine methyltransferase [Quadrisphaera granulorum]PWJ52689.1 release factor glutamine methyltransferase [Quadrisphaera granulorum]SZE97511.1 release factor glutamine methyltransferase [Quadrisphaera granulorum]
MSELLVGRLRAAGCVFAEEEAALLLEDSPSPAALEQRVLRRETGEPLELVLGWVAFAGLRVGTAPGVFVPRRRSELLVREGLAALASRAVRADAARLGRAAVVVDLCCGTGAVGLAVAVAAARQGVRVELHAADVDPVATACATQNLHDVDGARVHTGDLYAALPERLRGRVDLLLVNAPYVPTAAVALMPPEARDHEPLTALDGGDDGLDVHRRVAMGARTWLADGGVLLLETSAPQAEGTLAACRAGGLAAIAVTDHDLEASCALARA